MTAPAESTEPKPKPVNDIQSRIMRALFREGVPVPMIRKSADAVIAELGLRRERELDYGAPGASPPRHYYRTDWIDGV